MEWEGDPNENHSSSSDNDNDTDSDAEMDDTSYYAAAYLSDQAFLHRMTGDAPSERPKSVEASQFLLEDRYTGTFQGILPDTGAARASTAGKQQFLALQREDPTVKLDTSKRGGVDISFGNNGTNSSIGVTTIKTPVGSVKFHVLDTPTPFLMCLADMDRLNVYLDNTTNKLIRKLYGGKTIEVPVTRKWGHPWFFLNKGETATAFLNEAEMRRLHRRFGHPSVDRLHKLLTKAGHEVEYEALEAIKRVCHHCQMKSDAPRRFKFTLRDEYNFNYTIVVDVMYLDGRPVLHVVDDATSFQAGRFLKNLSAKETWEALKLCWIDTYQGPPDVIAHDAGTNFAASEFKSEAQLAGIICKEIPVEAHWAIGKIERYHGPVRRAYEILRAETKDSSPEAILQMAFKATIRLEGWVQRQAGEHRPGGHTG